MTRKPLAILRSALPLLRFAVPLAALGFLSPVLCAAAMGVSDLVIIGNALRLRSWSSKRR